MRLAFDDFMKGNEAAAEAAVRAGCRCYFFYPLTPQSEIAEYLVNRMPEVDGICLQAEDEVAVINMAYGAAATGKRTMTSSSGCGISLFSEGISYIAAAELPVVLIDVMRGGPGLGSNDVTQADYNQFVKGGGHGGYKMPVFGPSSIQELADNVFQAFSIAEKYRTPVGILIDAFSGQMMESVRFPDPIIHDQKQEWALTGCAGRKKNTIRTGYGPIYPTHTEDLYKKYEKMSDELQCAEEHETQDADIIVVAFGLMGRIVRSAVDSARKKGIKVGLLRPITLWPFPINTFEKYRNKNIKFLTVELNNGQMLDDVLISVDDRKSCSFMRGTGVAVPTVEEIVARIQEIDGERS